MNTTLVTRAGNLPALPMNPGDVGAVMQTLQSLAASYRDVSIANAREATQRVAIREQARVLIEQFHEETERYRVDLGDDEAIAFSQRAVVKQSVDLLAQKGKGFRGKVDANTFIGLVRTNMERVCLSVAHGQKTAGDQLIVIALHGIVAVARYEIIQLTIPVGVQLEFIGVLCH